ncbi:MAG TPA: PEP/pyruvate-binding domain-containing protein, partial [Herpetosiphonaceae bacterium]
MTPTKNADPLISWLDDPAARQAALAGGKGASLAALRQNGFPVPDGFVIGTAAYRRFVAANDLEPAIAAALAGAEAADSAGLERAAGAIHAAFMAAAIPDEVRAAIIAAYDRLGRPPAAVCSSAVAEDSAAASFAGQHETFLGLDGEAALLAAVKGCWASLWTGRALAYRRQRGLDADWREEALAVVTQRMVAAETAGVLFTCNPLTDSRDELVINAAPGLGEALVSGQVAPESIIIDRRSGAVLER